MKSCIYEGLIRHRRTVPKHHEFYFRSYMFMLDLDELNSVFKKRWLWSTSRPAFARFLETAHLKKHLGSGDLRERLLIVLEDNGVTEAIGPIRVLTQLRYLGFAMNPVSFFYCYDPEETRVVAIVAEVNNTPWGEQHVYVIPATAVTTNSNVVSNRIEKVFHVSPFMSLDMWYQMTFSTPGKKLGVKIENRQHVSEPTAGAPTHSKVHNVTMSLKRKPINSSNLNLMLIKYPLVSLKIFLAIYWQALRLYLKRIPFCPHPGKPSSNAAPPSAQNILTPDNECCEQHVAAVRPSDDSDSTSVLVSR